MGLISRLNFYVSFSSKLKLVITYLWHMKNNSQLLVNFCSPVAEYIQVISLDINLFMLFVNSQLFSL
jgi:hypothetical protein